MSRPAPADHPLHELILNRHSTRAIAERPVERAKLLSLLEAARWAASSYNDQPWHFIMGVKDEQPEVWNQLHDCMVEFNQTWAGKAPVLLLAVGRMKLGHNGMPNRHALHDVGAARAQLSLLGVAMGRGAHPIAGFNPGRARGVFAIPEEFEPITMMAIGYPGDPAALPEALRTRETVPRVRRPLSSMVFAGKWGETSPVIP